mgnify:CR=1 FL=1
MNDGTSICLVTRDRPGTLRATVEAIRQFADNPYEVILVDNGSTDYDTRALLAMCEAYGWTVVRNIENMGLSRATNQGLALGQYDCLIHLDDDALLEQQGWNQGMRSYFKHPQVGLVMPFQGSEFIDQGEYREIRWGLGLTWAIRKTLFDDIGGYDPQLTHQNECDLCLRVRMAGFHVAGVPTVQVHHNEPHGPRSDISLAREHLGVVQYRDKWTAFFRGREWNYGTLPLYLMQHWPPDQEWYRRFALQNGVDLNPAPEGAKIDTSPGSVLGLTDETAAKIERRVQIRGQWYLAYCDLRNDYSYFETEGNGYAVDRQRAIARWYELTGEQYEGYKWPNFLRPAETV